MNDVNERIASLVVSFTTGWMSQPYHIFTKNTAYRRENGPCSNVGHEASMGTQHS